MYPNNSSGGWRCRVKVRARQNPAERIYYHRAGGGYVRRRAAHLQQQRASIVGRLAELEKEAAAC